MEGICSFHADFVMIISELQIYSLSSYDFLHSESEQVPCIQSISKPSMKTILSTAPKCIELYEETLSFVDELKFASSLQLDFPLFHDWCAREVRNGKGINKKKANNNTCKWQFIRQSSNWRRRKVEEGVYRVSYWGKERRRVEELRGIEGFCSVDENTNCYRIEKMYVI